MRLTFRRAMVATALLVLSASISVAGEARSSPMRRKSPRRGAPSSASRRSLKRFDVLDYQLDATEDAVWVSPCGGQAIGLSFPSAKVALIPDANGRLSGHAHA